MYYRIRVVSNELFLSCFRKNFPAFLIMFSPPKQENEVDPCLPLQLIFPILGNISLFPICSREPATLRGTAIDTINTVTPRLATSQV